VSPRQSLASHRITPMSLSHGHIGTAVVRSPRATPIPGSGWRVRRQEHRRGSLVAVDPTNRSSTLAKPWLPAEATPRLRAFNFSSLPTVSRSPARPSPARGWLLLHSSHLDRRLCYVAIARSAAARPGHRWIYVAASGSTYSLTALAAPLRPAPICRLAEDSTINTSSVDIGVVSTSWATRSTPARHFDSLSLPPPAPIRCRPPPSRLTSSMRPEA